MKVKEIVLAAANALGIEEGVTLYFAGTDQAYQKEGERLLACFNLVENELALDYLPLHAEDVFETETGRLEFAAFKFAPVRIVRVMNEIGESVRFSVFPEYLKTEVGKLTVRYTYTPNEKGIGGESDYVLHVSERLFVYGILAEYCLGEGMFEEASIWDKKYKDAIKAACKEVPCTRLKSRRWV